MRIREIAQTRVRYGYRKIRVLLNREGWKVGKYLVERLYREEGLTLHQRRKRRRRVAEHRRERFHPTGPNQVWSMDFVADQLADGRRFRSLTVVDIYTRECLAIESEQRLKGEDVVLVAEPNQNCTAEFRSCFTVTTEASFPVKRWICGPIRTECESHFRDRGSQRIMPLWNRSTERFGRNAWMPIGSRTLTETQQIVETWRREYNESRPHRALGEKTPNEFANEIAASRDLIGLQTAENSP